MTLIEGEVLIGRPPEVVFDFVADERNEPKYNPRMIRSEMITAGAIGRGTRFRVATKPLGHPMEMTVEFTCFERPSRLVSVTEMKAAHILGSLTFEPHESGTRMRWSWDIEPRGGFKLLAPIVARIGERQEAAIWASLKRYLETSEAPETA